MSILSSLYTGVSGLNANGQWLSVIGDNIANVNTIGFKGSTMSFGDILSQTFAGGGSTSQIGRGVNVEAVTTIFSQGTFQNTSSGLDLAIDGDGFFVVNHQGVNAYTRAGSFQVDQNGFIVNPSGDFLQGAGGSINVLTAQGNAQQTSNAGISANLNAADGTTTWTFATGAALPADGTYNGSTSTTVYDNLGGAHQVNVYYQKTGDNAWTAHYVYQNSAGNYVQAGTQAMTFTNGAMDAITPGANTYTWGGGAAAGSITISPDGTTQYAGDFAVYPPTQDGYAFGNLKNISIGSDGVITGIFTNGQTRTIGQVQLARFAAPTELTKLGNNLYAATAASGLPVTGNPEANGLGRILSSSLELSTVDLAEQFTNLITAQRGFQANTKIITTTDDLLNLLISIKQ
jgi:flagellar hook protein FlgE